MINRIKINKAVIISFFFLSAISHWPLASFSQESPPLSYYEIIEQRNFFKPVQDLNAITIPSNNTKTIDAKYNPETQEANVSELTITGIIKLKGKYKTIIEKKSTGEGFYIGIDDSIDGYTVKNILKDRVILNKDGEELPLLFKDVDTSIDFSPVTTENIKADIPKEIKSTPSTDINSYPNTIQNLRGGSKQKVRNNADKQ